MSKSTYTLRPATDADYDYLYQLHVASLRAAVEATWGWDDAFQEEHFRSHWETANRQIIVVDGVDIGTITLKISPIECFLALIEIHPDHQGQGIGSAVISDILADAHSRGLPVSLHVLKASPRAKRLYERFGFQVVEEREERYVMTLAVPG
jgi:ribosomal protein S18 acetylase RimI-like enzyme